METGIPKLKNPQIIISVADSESQDLTIKSLNSEPEMEEFNEDALVKNLLKELDIQKPFDENADIFNHNPNSPSGDCLHCNFLKKLTNLQQEIVRMNQEVTSTHEILNLKRIQNLELKNTVKRLENSLGKNSIETVLEQKENTCSCGNKCLIY